MRLHLKLTPNTEAVPYNYQHALTGALHKWLGQNNLHDKISLYSFSWLRGKVESIDGGLYFPQGARWFISFWEVKYAKLFIKGILNDTDISFGMKVTTVQEEAFPKVDGKHRFKVASPVLIRKNRDDLTRKHLSFKDEEAGKYLKRTLKSKLEEINVSCNDFTVSFDRNYTNARTKIVDIKGTKLKANLCPIIMEGDPKAIEFAWNVGIGELTGSGFGALL
jgi:CRISPR-associated endoribonuclease Cas6